MVDNLVDAGTTLGWDVTPDYLESTQSGRDIEYHIGKPITPVLQCRWILGYLCMGKVSGGWHAAYDTMREETYELSKKVTAYYAAPELIYRRRYGDWTLGVGAGAAHSWVRKDVTTNYEYNNVDQISETEKVSFTGIGWEGHVFLKGERRLTDRLIGGFWLGYRGIGPIDVRNHDDTETLDFSGGLIGVRFTHTYLPTVMKNSQ